MINLVYLERKGGVGIYINPEKINFMEERVDNATYIEFDTDSWVTISEPIEDVLAKLCVNDCIKLIK